MLTYKKVCEIRARIHNVYFGRCEECPIGIAAMEENNVCPNFFMNYPEKAEKILYDWDEKNPIYAIEDIEMGENNKITIGLDYNYRGSINSSLTLEKRGNGDVDLISSYGEKITTIFTGYGLIRALDALHSNRLS